MNHSHATLSPKELSSDLRSRGILRTWFPNLCQAFTAGRCSGSFLVLKPEPIYTLLARDSKESGVELSVSPAVCMVINHFHILRRPGTIMRFFFILPSLTLLSANVTSLTMATPAECNYAMIISTGLCDLSKLVVYNRIDDRERILTRCSMYKII